MRPMKKVLISVIAGSALHFTLIAVYVVPA